MLVGFPPPHLLRDVNGGGDAAPGKLHPTPSSFAAALGKVAVRLARFRSAVAQPRMRGRGGWGGVVVASFMNRVAQGKNKFQFAGEMSALDIGLTLLLLQIYKRVREPERGETRVLPRC